MLIFRWKFLGQKLNEYGKGREVLRGGEGERSFERRRRGEKF
jgi:hypothetical protein